MATQRTLKHRVLLGVVLACPGLSAARAADVFIRFKVVDPPGQTFHVTLGGWIHKENWYLPTESADVAGGQWSRWFDLAKWPIHPRMHRVGGVAEWPSLKLTLTVPGSSEPIRGSACEVQLADKPDTDGVVHSFTERSGSATIGFLLPHPLRAKKGEFETGTQMTARHLAWAKEASGGRAPVLHKFDLITSVWDQYDPLLARRATETLTLLGCNVVGGVPAEILRERGLRTYAATWHLLPDPDESAETWKKNEAPRIAAALASDTERWNYEHMAHYVITDEIQTLDFRRTARPKLNAWFRDYLRSRGESDASLGKPLADVEYPAEAMHEKSLPRQADLPTRKVMYYAGKFGQWWSVKQLRQTTDLVKQSFAGLPAGMKTETLPSDHSFFNAWGAPHTGMGYRGLDLFEIGEQRAVDIVSAEDWLGLNHMYGPSYTWTGAAALGYLSAIYRGGVGDRPVALRALITPSDDGYLRLKAYEALGQGAKSLFFWTFGPTYIGTENYWSDLRSEYDGIAEVARALEKAEKILYPARPVRDPVAVLYSVSHDLWHTDDPASFVENRLTWTALRHLSVQPDLLREEDVEAGRLAGYKVLYVTGQCLTRKASQQIDAWAQAGGVVYLAGGAATRDEFYEPYVPPFAAVVWPENAAQRLVKQSGHRYNERVDLPLIRPLARVQAVLEGERAWLPAIGYRLDLKQGIEPASVWATYEDGPAAGASVTYGRGTVVAAGFLPGLAYSPFKVGQTTLDEVWPKPPRDIMALPLLRGLPEPRVVTLSEPVVEASLLTGPEGSALVLVNHTYRPIPKLRVGLSSIHALRGATSTEGAPVSVTRTQQGAELELPLEWTDIVLLEKP